MNPSNAMAGCGVLAEATPPGILIADDQPSVVEALRMLLKSAGYQSRGVSSPAETLAALRAGTFEVLLIDLNYSRDTTSGAEGLDLLSQIRELDANLPVVIMTAWGNMELVVQAMQRGASDFITKPWDNARVLNSLQTQIIRRRSFQAQHADQAREFEEAREIQRGLLLREIPEIPGYPLAVAWRPAGFVGGDYYDILNFSDVSTALCIADVAGKGLPAALLMSNLQAAVKATATPDVPPPELCSKVNRLLCENTLPDRFVTFFYALLDAPRRNLAYCNAGHPPPILVHADGSWERLERGGTVLGGFRDCAFEQGDAHLASDDRVILYTDGITEAENAAGEQFDGGLHGLAVENRRLGARDLQETLMRAVAEYADGRFRDDATLIVLGVEELSDRVME